MNSRALLQEFSVNAWICVERGRLCFIANNQRQLKADKYKNLVKDVEEGIKTVGRKIILPSSFTGGPRHFRGLYQDAMASTCVYGPPSLFITMTANPNWCEIQETLRCDQTSPDRPDVGMRVFKMKLDQLLEDLAVHARLGVLKSWVYVIEFQMRGLPHVHFLGILDAANRPRLSTDVDEIVCSEIPDPEKEPMLYQLVKTHMFHGPCGPNLDTPCRTEAGCSKRFPKPYQAATDFPENSYPLY